MSIHFFGGMQEYIEASYAPTGRAKCKTCKDTIEKDSLRLGIIMNDDHFGGRSYYHPNCFSLKPRFKELDPETQIYKLNELEQEDADQILDIMHAELQRLKEGKKSSKRQTTKAKSKARKIDSKKYQPEKEEQKPKGRITRSRSKSMKDDKSQAPSKRSVSKSEAKSAKPAKKKKVKAKKKLATAGYTEDQFKKFNQYVTQFMKKSADVLKHILAANMQSRTGTKIELAEKCADGKLLGRIPMCSSCGGGKLRFNRKTGLYTCPGYMDDDQFRNCNKTFMMSEITRDPWTQP